MRLYKFSGFLQGGIPFLYEILISELASLANDCMEVWSPDSPSHAQIVCWKLEWITCKEQYCDIIGCTLITMCTWLTMPRDIVILYRCKNKN